MVYYHALIRYDMGHESTDSPADPQPSWSAYEHDPHAEELDQLRH
jgi:hypothetical protein